MSSDQNETIKAHDAQIMNGSLLFIPKDVRNKIAQKYHTIKNQSKDSESRTTTEPAINHLLAKAEPIIAPLKPKTQQIPKEEPALAPLKPKAAPIARQRSHETPIAPLKPKSSPIAQQRRKEEPRKSWIEDKARMKYPSFAEAVKNQRNNVKGTNLHAPTK